MYFIILQRMSEIRLLTWAAFWGSSWAVCTAFCMCTKSYHCMHQSGLPENEETHVHIRCTFQAYKAIINCTSIHDMMSARMWCCLWSETRLGRTYAKSGCAHEYHYMLAFTLKYNLQQPCWWWIAICRTILKYCSSMAYLIAWAHSLFPQHHLLLSGHVLVHLIFLHIDKIFVLPVSQHTSLAKVWVQCTWVQVRGCITCM